MFSKKPLKNKYEESFEDFMAADIDDNLFTRDSKKSKKVKEQPKNFWKDSDSSESIKLGTGKSFLKKKADTNDNKLSDSENVAEINVESISEENTVGDDFKLDLSDNTTASKRLNESADRTTRGNDDFAPHPITFEGITEPSYNKTRNTDNQLIENGSQNFGDELNTATNLEGTKEHLLSKVSLMDSNEYGRLDRTSMTLDDKNDPVQHPKTTNGAISRPPVHIPTSTDFNNQSSNYNMASGDSYNNTQGITNITDTMIGDTTAADFARFSRKMPHYDTTFQEIHESSINESESQKYPEPIHSQQPDLRNRDTYIMTPDSNIPNQHNIDTIKEVPRDTFVYSEELTTTQDQTLSPTPRPRHSILVSKSDQTNHQAQMKEVNVKRKSRYSNVPSSGYGIKPIVRKSSPSSTHSYSTKKSEIDTKKRPVTAHANSTLSRKSSNHSKDQKEHYTNYHEEPFQGFKTYKIDKNSLNEQEPLGRAREWQEKWLEERKIAKKLQIDQEIQERDFKIAQNSLIKKYEDKIHQLESQISQQKKMKIDLNQCDLKDGITREQLQKLQKEIEEQESLINGYQKDNERLYGEIRELKQKEKSNNKIDNEDHNRFLSQISSLQSDLESKNIQIHNLKGLLSENRKKDDYSSEAMIDEMSYLKQELKTMSEKLHIAQSENLKLASKMEKLESESEKLICQYQKEMDIEKIEKEKLKENHKMEVDDLKKKIKWYLENQAILNNESKKLKQKDEEILELRKQLENSDHWKISTNVRQKERSNDLARIKRLEEENLTLKSELYSLSKNKNIGNISMKRSVQFLEEKLERMEREKDENVNKEQRNLRSLQQQFEMMKAQYEDKIRDLELDLCRNTDQRSLRNEKETRISDLNKKIDELTKKLIQKTEQFNKLKKEQNSYSIINNNQQNKSNNNNNLRKIELPTNVELDNLKKEMRMKNKELDQLKMENNYLKSITENKRKADDNWEYQVDSAQLKSQIAHLTAELQQCQLQLENGRMEKLQIEQKIRQKYDLELEQINQYHKDQLKNVKIDFVNRHSDSDISNLKSQLNIQNTFIKNLQSQLEEANKRNENQTQQQYELQEANREIERLKSELKDLRVIWSNKPGLEMIERLRSKIVELEQKEHLKERYMEEYVQKMIQSRTDKNDEEMKKLKVQLNQKNQKLISIQHELNQLLNSLEELRRQGITIPKFVNHNLNH